MTLPYYLVNIKGSLGPDGVSPWDPKEITGESGSLSKMEPYYASILASEDGQGSPAPVCGRGSHQAASGPEGRMHRIHDKRAGSLSTSVPTSLEGEVHALSKQASASLSCQLLESLREASAHEGAASSECH